MGIHLAVLGIFATIEVGGIVAMLNPKIVGWILIILGFVWLIGFYTAWFIYKRRHRDFTKEIVQSIWPRKGE